MFCLGIQQVFVIIRLSRAVRKLDESFSLDDLYSAENMLVADFERLAVRYFRPCGVKLKGFFEIFVSFLFLFLAEKGAGNLEVRAPISAEPSAGNISAFG